MGLAQKQESEKIHICLVLNLRSEVGGKFQYALSLFESLITFDKTRFIISIVYNNILWSKYLSQNSLDVHRYSRNIFSKIFKEVVLLCPNGLNLWRKYGRYIDPLQRILFSLNPDIVIFPGDYHLSYECSLPSVVPIFDLMHRYERSFPEVGGKNVFKSREYFYPKVCQYATGILVDSEVGKKHVIESYEIDPNKIFILPYVAPSYVRMKSKDIDISSKYKLPARFIFYPAQMWRHKNHEAIVKAIHILQKKGIIVNAIFVGSEKNAGKDVRNLIHQLNLTNQVVILSYVNNEELVAFYKKAVALIMPTYFGPTNIPQLEAFALSCPVLTSNIYGIPEQVGKAALLFHPGNINEIVEKIELVWMNEAIRTQLVQAGREKDLLWNMNQFGSRLSSIIEYIHCG